MSETTPSAPLSLLIVDDEPDIIELLQAVLEDEGFTVLTASNGAAALYLVQHTTVALVLTDLMMPIVSGLELARRLRGNPATAKIPLLLMSATVPQRIEDLFAQVIPKPFSIDTVIDLVHQLLP
jgi:CheY-like chemotaxis protein